MDTPDNNNKNIRTETLHSHALLLKEFTATEKVHRESGRFLSGSRFKALMVPFLYRLLQHTPLFIALVPVRLVALLMHALYWWPNNPLRLSCKYICHLADRARHKHQPAHVYRRYLANAIGAAENYFHLHRFGIKAVLDRIQITSEDAEKINNIIRHHGGAIIAVPHNFGSAFSALKLNRTFPLLVVTRNSSTIDRTKAALDFFERMEITILMVRGGNPFELSRTLFSVLKSNKAVAATVDNISHSDAGTKIRMFGQQIELTQWAAKIAARKRIPVVPSYFHSNGRQIIAEFGEPITTDNIETAIQHYATFFERCILEDPSSWAYLGDKHWRRVLHQANEPVVKLAAC